MLGGGADGGIEDDDVGGARLRIRIRWAFPQIHYISQLLYFYVFQILVETWDGPAYQIRCFLGGGELCL